MFKIGDVVYISDKINGEDIELDSIIDGIEIFKEIYELIKGNIGKACIIDSDLTKDTAFIKFSNKVNNCIASHMPLSLASHAPTNDPIIDIDNTLLRLECGKLAFTVGGNIVDFSTDKIISNKFHYDGLNHKNISQLSISAYSYIDVMMLKNNNITPTNIMWDFEYSDYKKSGDKV